MSFDAVNAESHLTEFFHFLDGKCAPGHTSIFDDFETFMDLKDWFHGDGRMSFSELASRFDLGFAPDKTKMWMAGLDAMAEWIRKEYTN